MAEINSIMNDLRSSIVFMRQVLSVGSFLICLTAVIKLLIREMRSLLAWPFMIGVMVYLISAISSKLSISKRSMTLHRILYPFFWATNSAKVMRKRLLRVPILATEEKSLSVVKTYLLSLSFIIFALSSL